MTTTTFAKWNQGLHRTIQLGCERMSYNRYRGKERERERARREREREQARERAAAAAAAATAHPALGRVQRESKDARRAELARGLR